MPSIDAVAPEESVPFGRIARFAVYAIAIFAVGYVAAGVLQGALTYVTVFLAGFGEPALYYWVEGVDLLRDGVRVFAALVAIGVFLSQFEHSA